MAVLGVTPASAPGPVGFGGTRSAQLRLKHVDESAPASGGYSQVSLGTERGGSRRMYRAILAWRKVGCCAVEHGTSKREADCCLAGTSSGSQGRAVRGFGAPRRAADLPWSRNGVKTMALACSSLGEPGRAILGRARDPGVGGSLHDSGWWTRGDPRL